MKLPIIICCWLLLLSIYAFFRMGWDKRSANKQQWRTSEMHFWVIASLGGSLGVLLGMQYWRHKTQKFSFKWPVYLIIIGQVLLCIYWVWSKLG